MGGFLWLIAMSRFELSFIYPFFSINYVVVLVGSSLLLKEEVSWVRYVAIICIFVGLLFISQSHYIAVDSELKEGQK